MAISKTNPVNNRNGEKIISPYVSEPADSRIVSVDKTDRGVIITFADGKSALYPNSLLRAVYLKAEIVSDWKVDPSISADDDCNSRNAPSSVIPEETRET